MISLSLITLYLVSYTSAGGHFCEETQNEPWSYGGNNGPKKWYKIFRNCGGNMQSPIDVAQNSVKKMWGEYPEFYGYKIPFPGKVENNGNTVVITPTDRVKRGVVVGGTNFTLQEIHFHFSANKRSGSEHVRDGRRVTMEMHLVHRSKDRRTAVFAILFKETIYNPAMQSIVYAVSDVTYRGDTARFTKPINLYDVLPSCESTFYRYFGSLTTPPCTEGIIWTVFKYPNTISNDQMTAFLQQKSTSRTTDRNSQCPMGDNVRPLQNANGRKIMIYNSECQTLYD